MYVKVFDNCKFKRFSSYIFLVYGGNFTPQNLVDLACNPHSGIVFCSILGKFLSIDFPNNVNKELLQLVERSVEWLVQFFFLNENTFRLTVIQEM